MAVTPAVLGDALTWPTICANAGNKKNFMFLLGIAGGSGSGKTTLAQAFKDAQILSFDSYYKDITHKTLEDRAATNFDHPDALDSQLLCQHLRALRRGETIHAPTYDFSTHSRLVATVPIHASGLIVVEGILLLADENIATLCDLTVFVDTPSDVRLQRRISRDMSERGRDLESVMRQYETFVRPMHIQFVEPSKDRADVVVSGVRPFDCLVQTIIKM